MATILAIESTCDETGVAVVRDGREVLSNVVASSAGLHMKYRGVVPEIASRACIEHLLPTLREAIAASGVVLAEVDAIAVANRPGLVGSLLVGITAAKTLAWSLSKPLVAVNHVHAHLYSVMLDSTADARSARGLTDSVRRERSERSPQFPAVGLVCSGGHTALYRIDDWLHITRLGGTIDDAVGEAYDKVAALLGLGYPGGPILDRLAAEGDPKAIDFPRSLLGRESLDFSFSGLKTSVLYHVRGFQGRERPLDLTPQTLRDIAASFQAACVDVIVKKLKRAIGSINAKSVIVGGGVAANRGLRAALRDRLGVPVHLPLPTYCTDNAAMSAGLADVLLAAGDTASLDLDAIATPQMR